MYNTKKVDGVYDKDPVLHADAKKFDELSYIEVLQKELKVMDSTATSLCMDNNIPIKVFELTTENILKAVHGENSCFKASIVFSICFLRKYTLYKNNKTMIPHKKTNNQEFIKLLQDANVQIIF